MFRSFQSDNIPEITLIISVVLLIIALLLPINIFDKIGNIQLPGLITIFLFPILSIVGLIFSIKYRNFVSGVLNMFLLLSFFALIFIGNVINLF